MNCVIMPVMIAAVDDLVREIAIDLWISVGSVRTIAAEEEHYRRVCARWIPRPRTPEIKE